MNGTKKYYVMTKPWDYFIWIYFHELQIRLSDTNVIYGQDKRNVHKFEIMFASTIQKNRFMQYAVGEVSWFFSRN